MAWLHENSDRSNDKNDNESVRVGTTRSADHLARSEGDTYQQYDRRNGFNHEAATKEKEIHITHSIEPEIMLNSNSDKMKQLVMILLDNAHKYTNEKGNIDI